MSISGGLCDASVVEMLQFIGMVRRSGTLRVTSDDRCATIRMSRGNIVGASRPGTTRLGDLLLEADVIDARTLAVALRTQKEERPRRTLGKILVAIGATTTETIRKTVERQITDTIYETVAWMEGSFEFVSHEFETDDDIGLAPSDVLPRVNLNTQMILMDALRVLDEQKQAQLEAASAAEKAVAVDPATDFGLNDCIKLGRRSYHIQTEVCGRGELTIRTTVIESGRVHCAVREPYPGHLTDPQGARAFVDAQHKHVLNMVQNGEMR